MKFLKKSESGLAQLIVLGMMALLAAALPVTTKLVQKSQENRSKAAENNGITILKLEPRLYFNVSKSSYYLDETFEVTVRVDSAFKKISGVDVVGNYDASRLTLISMKKSDDFVFGNTGDCSIQTNVSGKFMASCYVKSLSDEKVVLGKLLTIVFKTKAAGPASFGFDCVNGSSIDSNIVSNGVDVIYCENMVTQVQVIDEIYFPKRKIVGKFIDLNLDEEYLKVISDDKLNLWLSRLDMAYEDYAELTSWKPYNGGKITIDSVQCGNTCPGWAWAGQTISWARQWWQQEELRKINNNNDWSFGILHELSHDFDNYNVWGDFDNEMMANFKMAYVLEKRSAVVQPNSDGVYYTGTDIIKVYKSHPEYGYDVVLKKYKDGKTDELKQSIGNFLNYKLLVIKDNIGGWSTYKQVFRNLTNKNFNSANEKLNSFLNEMTTVSKKDVRSMFTQEEKAILELRFGSGIFPKVTSTPILTPTPMIKLTPTPLPMKSVDGKCGSSRNTCISGVLSDGALTDTSSEYRWKCLGIKGGKDASCSFKKIVTPAATSTPLPVKSVDGKCGSTRNTCTSGMVSVMVNHSIFYQWRCVGRNGGKTVICSIRNR